MKILKSRLYQIIKEEIGAMAGSNEQELKQFAKDMTDRDWEQLEDEEQALAREYFNNPEHYDAWKEYKELHKSFYTNSQQSESRRDKRLARSHVEVGR